MNSTLKNIVSLLPALALAACAASPSPAGEQTEAPAGPDFAEAVEGKTWALQSVTWNGGENGGGGIEVNRAGNQQPDVYTIVFGADGQVTGKGAPNRYNGPYTAGPGTIDITENMASTRMMGLSASPGIREDVYYGFLARARTWRIDGGGALILGSATEEGQSAEMRFTAVE